MSQSIKKTRGPVAHHRTSDDAVQTVEEHLREVAEMARGFAEPFGGGEVAYVSGLWHDLGKYCFNFQQRILANTGLDPTAVDPVSAGKMDFVDHKSAGAVHALERFGRIGLANLVAGVIAGHHGGLSDRSDLLDELAGRRDALNDALKGTSAGVPPKVILDHARPAVDVPIKSNYDLDMLTRFVASSVCDADGLDTEAFCSPWRAKQRGAMVTSLATLSDRAELFATNLSGLGTVNKLRREVAEKVLAGAALPPGFFSFTGPTGIGKTLAALRFGLKHGATNKLRRLVYCVAFTAVTEQTADEYSSILGRADVLEHHSTLDTEKETLASALATENWDSTVIVTTMVQFFESLFANRRERLRKLHNIVNSIIIIDEPQTIPPAFIAPIMDVLGSLVRDYGCSVLFTSATMPDFEKRERFSGLDDKVRELVSAPRKLAQKMRRWIIEWPRGKRATTLQKMASRVKKHRQVLAVVNFKVYARELAKLVPGALLLSSDMCPAHRQKVLKQAKKSLKAGEPVTVVATPVIEAGTDIDFPVVFTQMCGIDSLTQRGGRSNREGKLKTGKFVVVRLPRHPKTGGAAPHGQPLTGLGITEAMLEANPGLDILDPAVQNAFFHKLYNASSLDKNKVQALRQDLAFDKVAHAFRLIDPNVNIVIPYDRKSRAAIKKLKTDGPSRRLFRLLQRYSVRVRLGAFDQFKLAGVLTEVHDVFVLTVPSLYNETYGLEKP